MLLIVSASVTVLRDFFDSLRRFFWALFMHFDTLKHRVARWAILAVAMLISPAVLCAQGVVFDRAIYQVAPGETFDVQVLLDANLATSEANPLENGLFSYGWQVAFDSSKATIDGLTVPAPLDYFGFASGASIVTDPGLAAAEGNIDQVMLTPYGDSLLATITLTNIALVPDEYDLTLSLAPHFPTEQLFLDGEGNVLDDTLVFGVARVVVAVPEPSACGLAALSALTLGVWRARKTRRCAS
jgi:hypothetical protein